MDCPSADKIAELVEGALGADEANGVHHHVRTCSACRMVLAGLGAAVELEGDPAKAKLATSSEATAQSSYASEPRLAMPALKPGMMVGRFRVERLLGRGGMGSVWAAADPELGREVAIKLLLVGVGSDADQASSRKRLLREAKSMARLSHPNVVPVFEIGEVQGRLFLVMELVLGQTLAQWLVNRDRPLPELLDKFIAAGQGLSAAHAAGVIHRDFKPENVLVGTDGRARVTDFGLARDHLTRGGEAAPSDAELLESITPLGLTPMGALLGTPAYMSPEQMRGQRADSRSDLFAFCTALYEALVGVRPFAAKNLYEMRRRIEAGELEWPRDSNVPRGLKRLLAQGLRNEPRERNESMEELLDGLRLERARSERRLLLPAAATALVLLLAVGVYAALHRPVSAPAVRWIAVLAPRNASAAQENADWIAPLLEEVLASDLSGDAKVRLIPGDEVALALADLELTGKAPLASDVARLRTRLSADLILGGKYSRAADGIVTCELQLWEPKGNAALLADRGDEAHLLELATRLGLAARRALGLSAQLPAGTAAFPADLQVARLYTRGLELLRSFQSAPAIEELRRAAALAPENPLVQLALADACSALRQEDSARTAAQRAYEISEALGPEEHARASLLYFRSSGDVPRAIDFARERHLAEPGDLRRGLDLGRELINASRYQEALELTRALHKLPPPAGSDPRVDSLETSARASMVDLKGAVISAQRAYDSARERGARWMMAQSRLIGGYAFRRLGDVDKGVAMLAEAQELYAGLGDKSGAAKVEMSLATIRADRGDLPGARKMFDEVLATDIATGDRLAEGQILQNLSVVLRRAHDLPAALAYANRATALNLELRQMGPAASSMNTLGNIEGDMGNVTAAIETLTRACEMRRQAKSPLLVSCLSSLTDVVLLRGDLVLAQKLADEAAGLGTMEKMVDSRVHATMSKVLFAQHQYQRALAEATNAAASAKETAQFDEEALAESTVARSQLALGQIPLARAAVDRALALTKASTSLVARNPVSVTEARVLAAEHPNDLVEALGILNAVVGEAAQTGVVDEGWEARLAIAQIEDRAGLPGAHDRLLRYAKKAQAQGLFSYAQQAADDARALR